MAVRVAYILGEFPSQSETFIAREIEGLCRLGARITIFSIRGAPSDRSSQAARRAGVEELVYRGHAPVRVDPPEGKGMEPPEGPMPPPLDFPNLARAVSRAVSLERSDLGGCLRALRNTGAAASFARHIARRGIPHVHAHFATVPTTLAFMIQALAPVRVSFSAHAQDIWLHGRTLPRKIGAADLIITCTHYNREALLQYCADRQASKIHVVHHGINLEEFGPMRARRTREIPMILAVGRLVPKKGFDRLVGACEILKRRRVAFRCKIVGSGPEEESLRELIGQKELGKTIDLVGFVPNEQMVEHYKDADLLVCPSVVDAMGDRDGLPNVILEAMAAGTLVIASHISATPEAVEHEKTGILTPEGDAEALANAIVRLLGRKDLRKSLATAARQRVEQKFDHIKNARQVYELFEGLQ